MRVLTRAFLWLALSLSGAALAELGPIDGRELTPTDIDRVTLGSAAPDFTLTDSAGNPLTLSSVAARDGLVLVFYRGHW